MDSRVHVTSHESQQSIRVDRAIRILFLGFVIVALSAVAMIASAPFLIEIMLAGDGEIEFVDVTAHSARVRLQSQWPNEVAESDVESVSYKSVSTRDTYHTWYRIKLSKQAALQWIRSTHSSARHAASDGFNSDRHIEGIQRTVRTSVPPGDYADSTPDWWFPPELDFLSTERMLWYGNSTSDSGVGYQVRTAYDKATGILWVFKCAEQHKWLWKLGAPPHASEYFGHKPNG